jgi:hypothetical protein
MGVVPTRPTRRKKVDREGKNITNSTRRAETQPQLQLGFAEIVWDDFPITSSDASRL